jgi:hypothetical protein
MRIWIVIIVLFTSNQLSAQKKINFQTQVQAGLLEGGAGSAFQLQVINGVKFKTWSAGIGAGLDYYQARSIPVFLEVQKAFIPSSKTPFVYLNGGHNFPWLREKDKDWNWTATGESTGGLYFDAGVGYQLPVLKSSALYFSAGYSVKKYSTKSYYDRTPTIYSGFSPASYAYDFTFRRLSIKTGLRF